MKKVYLMTVLILVVNYIFFVDSFKSDMSMYKAELEKMNIMSNVEEVHDETKDIMELTGIQVIEAMEREILRGELTSIDKVYTQITDENKYKIHELSITLEGTKEDFRKFLQRDIFQEEYKLKEISIYEEEEKELMKIIVLVRSL